MNFARRNRRECSPALPSLVLMAQGSRLHLLNPSPLDLFRSPGIISHLLRKFSQLPKEGIALSTQHPRLGDTSLRFCPEPSYLPRRHTRPRRRDHPADPGRDPSIDKFPHPSPNGRFTAETQAQLPHQDRHHRPTPSTGTVSSLHEIECHH